MTVHNSKRLVGLMNWKEQVIRLTVNPPKTHSHTYTSLSLYLRETKRSHALNVIYDIFFRLNLSHIRQQMYDFCHLTKNKILWHVINAIFRAWCLSRKRQRQKQNNLLNFKFFSSFFFLFSASCFCLSFPFWELNWIELKSRTIQLLSVEALKIPSEKEKKAERFGELPDV